MPTYRAILEKEGGWQKTVKVTIDTEDPEKGLEEAKEKVQQDCKDDLEKGATIREICLYEGPSAESA